MSGDTRRKVAFLGPEASYTHQAALDAFKGRDVTLSPQVTIADVFTAVQKGTAYRGVVPFENSSNGSVVFTLDLIADLHGMHPDILVCGESYVDVKHCLLGYVAPNVASADLQTRKLPPVEIDKKFTNPLAVPVCDLSRIKKLYSHPQAWGQCKAFLSTYLKGIERQDVSSTSRAAELVAQDTSGESAALSSFVAAELFGLDVLAESINDRIGNATRFLVIRRKDTASPSSTPPPDTTHSTDGNGSDWKTLVTFTVDHANPGALANCLAVFGKYGLNLTSINTRPSGVRNWHYVFFVEFKGRKEDGDEVGSVNQALKELDRVCSEWRWLGSWENRL
ncbi:Prephenate dehydratase-domain-containing protein [Paraphoma chrysanthemicola]|nr:Prephenate dehydratase-domain-containing protein [Paraphoma chrysanthemicola]